LEKDNTNAQENCIYGIRAVIEAIKAGKELDKILLQKGLSNDLFHQLKKEIAGKEIPYQFVPPEKTFE
jgi:23S rRNA (guanosine2251-2'-O)-methyltransferase